jgi:hypothetical protein
MQANATQTADNESTECQAGEETALETGEREKRVVDTVTSKRLYEKQC